MCEALVQEQEWINKRQVLELQCSDKDDFVRGDISRKVLFPNVHPTSHARPVFLRKFSRKSESFESDESNEVSGNIIKKISNECFQWHFSL